MLDFFNTWLGETITRLFILYWVIVGSAVLTVVIAKAVVIV